MTETDMGRHAMIAYGEGAEQIIQQTQLWWGPEGITKAVAFFVSDDGACITLASPSMLMVG